MCACTGDLVSRALLVQPVKPARTRDSRAVPICVELAILFAVAARSLAAVAALARAAAAAFAFAALAARAFAAALGAAAVVLVEAAVVVAGGGTTGVVAGAVVAVVATGAAHDDLVIVSVSSVTAPFRASTRPSIVTPVVTVMLVSARIVPRKVEPVPSVAELPTCQKTLQDWAPLIRFTELADAVVSVDPAWKTKTAFGLPPPSSVSAPLNPIAEAEL
jgi:hypothetical protein